jgi:peptidoglycan/LPS O-acetylase OafA/YrhL
LAAVLVALRHAPFALPETIAGLTAKAWLAPVVAPLVVGVDLFFVISGVVMAAAIDGARPPSAGHFLLKRALRIYPLYGLALLIMLPSALTGVGLAARPIDAGRFLLNLSLLPQADLIVTQGWTLTHELLFYGVVAGALAFGWRRWLPTMVAALALVALAQVATGTRLAHGYLMSCFLLEFLAGLLLYRIRGRLAARLGGGLGGGWGALLCGLAVGGFCVVAGTIGAAPDTLAEPVRVALFGGVAALMVAGALGLEGGGLPFQVPALLRRVALRLGDTSYSIYLFHPALIGGCGAVFALLPAMGPVGLVGAALTASAVAVAYGVAMGTLIELPLQARLAALLRRRPVAEPASAPAE